MRYRVRIQPYVSPDVHRKLRAYSAVHDLTDSAVAEAALTEYLGQEGVEEALVLRRLGGVDEAVARVQRDVEVLSQTVAALARYALASAPTEFPPGAGRRATQLFMQVLAQAAKEMDSGVRLAGLLDRARGESATARPQDTGSGQ
jgi:hypothetical protein